jgi:hypothetical protein
MPTWPQNCFDRVELALAFRASPGRSGITCSCVESLQICSDLFESVIER